ncbi:MAG: ABC transporter permease subunit [Myxococcota bacterium]
MSRFLLDVVWVAVYELGEAVRTRLFQLVLLAYAGGVAVATWLFTEILRHMEEPLAESMGVPPTKRPGAMMNTLLERGKLDELLEPVTGADGVAHLLDEPVLALWTGAVAMALLPMVLLFSASGSVAGEVRTRSIRYLLCRTGRLQIGLGKLAGQLLLALVAAVLGSIVAWGMGMTLMVGNPPIELAAALVSRTGRACVYALPFAGLGLAVSQVVPSPNGARALAVMVFGLMSWATAWLGDHVGPDTAGRLADLAMLFYAPATWDDFWSAEPGTVGIAAAQCVVLSVVYYAAGHGVFARRDL